MGWRVALTEQALADLENAVAFLAKKSPVAAERMGMALVDTIFALEQFPNRGTSMRNRPLRKIALGHHLIIYRVNETDAAVEIVRIWDARQDPDKLMQGNADLR